MRRKQGRTALDKEIFTLIQNEPGLLSREIADKLDCARPTVTNSAAKWWKEQAITRFWSEADNAYRYYPIEYPGKEKKRRISSKKMRLFKEHMEEREATYNSYTPLFLSKGPLFAESIARLWELAAESATGKVISNEELNSVRESLQGLHKALTYPLNMIELMLNREELWDASTLAVFLYSDDEDDNNGGDD
jgi:DNA-binding MarR family transcriptional regulator